MISFLSPLVLVAFGLVLVTAKTARAWAAGLLLILTTAFYIGATSGYPAHILPPADSTVLMVAPPGYVWAVPPGTTIPRAYTIDDPKQAEQALRQFHGRPGPAANTPMQWRGEPGLADTRGPLIDLPASLPKE